MVNYDLILFGIFAALLVVFYFRNKKKIEFQGIVALYKTKLGLALSKKMVHKRERPFIILGYIGIVLGFIGMVFIFYTLVSGSLNVFFKPQAAPVVAPVLPFVKIPGLPPLLFTYWIISIFIVAVIHEFSHALLSVAHKVKVKSSGFAFFGPIPAAFVEPDEKQLAKRSKAAQLSVFAAGPFSNIITGILFFLIFAFLIAPYVASMANVNLAITDVVDGSPAFLAGLQKGQVIERMNSLEASPQNVSSVLATLKPNEILEIESSGKTYTLKTDKNPQNQSKGFIGISIEAKLEPKQETSKAYFSFMMWLRQLFFWLFALSLGIGLFNLLPLGPIDGGRMLLVGLGTFVKDENKTKRIFAFISFLSLLFILINLAPWLAKAFGFLGRIGG